MVGRFEVLTPARAVANAVTALDSGECRQRQRF
jgi:hypothetical protein